MSDTTESLRRKISSAGDLQSVVRTMKAMAASSIGQYEKSVRALSDYYRTVELGLGACFREIEPTGSISERQAPIHASTISAIVFGSDQGLVGRFNDAVADYAIKTLAALPGKSKSGRWASAYTRAWQMQAYHWPDSSPYQTPSRRSPRSSGRFKSKAKRIRLQVSMRLFGCSITARYRERSTNRLVSDYCHSMRNGDNVWSTSTGRPETCPRSWAAAPRLCVRSFGNISSSRSSGPAPNRSQAKTRAAWQQWSAPTKTSTTCWKIFTAHSTDCDRAGIDEELFDVVSGFEALVGPQ